LLKCLCNLNQQDMQVEGCELTPILSPDSTNSPPTQDTENTIERKAAWVPRPDPCAINHCCLTQNSKKNPVARNSDYGMDYSVTQESML